MHNKLVSVVVPIYNVMQYLERCIDSIISQTYTSIEIILVDDGSTDKSGEICDAYEKKDSRIIVVHKNNGGLSSARNAGLARAHGEYICFIDSDDYIDVRMIETLLNGCVENNSQISICSHIDVDDSDKVMSTSRIPTGKMVNMNSEQAFRGFLKNINGDFVVAWNKLYCKKLFENIEYPVGKIHEDCFVTYKLMLLSSKITYIQDGLYFYRHRSGSIMGNANIEKEYAVIEAYKEILSITKEKYKQEIPLAEKMYAQMILGVVNKISLQKDKKYIKRLKEDFGYIDYKSNMHISKINKIRIGLFMRCSNIYILLNKAMIKIVRNGRLY